jgi:hypothetical protein
VGEGAVIKDNKIGMPFVFKSGDASKEIGLSEILILKYCMEGAKRNVPDAITNERQVHFHLENLVKLYCGHVTDEELADNGVKWGRKSSRRGAKRKQRVPLTATEYYTRVKQKEYWSEYIFRS